MRSVLPDTSSFNGVVKLKDLVAEARELVLRLCGTLVRFARTCLVLLRDVADHALVRLDIFGLSLDDCLELVLFLADIGDVYVDLSFLLGLVECGCDSLCVEFVVFPF